MSDESAFTFLPLGAIIQEFRIAGLNIVQSFPDASLYQAHNKPFFGETIGRTTNRIRDGKIELNGKSIQLFQNNGPNSLHGGSSGWGKKVFQGPEPVNRNGNEGVKFTYLSPDGDEGYPGTVELRVWYMAGEEVDGKLKKTVLEVEYEVEFVGNECEETFVGVTNHGYFNLSGFPTIEGTIASLATTSYLPLDSNAIPKGPIESYPGLQSNEPFTLGPTDPDIDDCFIVNVDPASVPLDTRPLSLNLLAAFSHPSTNIHLEVYSTEPAFQFYTGKFINVPECEDAMGNKVPARGPRSGFCVEPSRYVNAAGVDEWKGMVRLKKGAIWGSRIVYKAWKSPS